MKSLSSFFGFLAILVWFCAIALLAWQSWQWLQSGYWNSVPLHAAFYTFFGFRPVGEGLIPMLLIWDLMQQSLLTVLVCVGVLVSGLAKILDH